jgi:4-hydroxybenzoate polyprenyltransferase
VHMRPYLLFVSGTAGLSGMALVPGTAELWRYLLAFFAFFTGYGFGQALTDCFQTDTDSISAPYRPLSRGIISKQNVLAISLTGLITGGILLLLLNWYNAIFVLLSIVGLATYTYFKKNHWWLGPFYNAIIVVYLGWMGYLSISRKGLIHLFDDNDLIYLSLLTFLSYTNFVLMGYLKDIEADRATGYKTFPVLFGWKATCLVGDFLAILSVFFCFNLIEENNWRPLSIFIIAVLLAAAGQYSAHRAKSPTPENAAFAIECTVRSFLLWHLAIIVSFKPAWLIYSILFYALFELALYLRPSKEQI